MYDEEEGGAQISMAGVGNPYENAKAARASSET